MFCRVVLLCCGVLSAAGSGFCEERWRGLVVAPEERCAPYNRKRDYPYAQTVERHVAASLGMIYGPYTGTCFDSMRQTDIEHVVATSEAHDSGLCGRDLATKRRFASDVRNLTLAAPEVNRNQKGGKDAAEWMPEKNRCWFAGRVVGIRLAYELTIDRREAEALERVLSGCESVEMEPVVCAADRRRTLRRGEANWVLDRYDDNGDGGIWCSEACRHGIAPVSRDHPAYRYMRDGDSDGVICEAGCR